jgi:hypothetical protein
MNLAALEVVDYVMIDENVTPIESIKFLQPDYFAKGYEYFEGGGIHPRTREELAVLGAYGGELIFTPGDVVFSSSAFIEQAPPNIAADKLMTLMESDGCDVRRAPQGARLVQGSPCPRRRRHHRGLVHLLHDGRRHDEDPDVQREV